MLASLCSLCIAASGPSPAGSVELGMWKAVVVIGVGAFVVFGILRRLSAVMAKRRTDEMIRSVVSEQERITEKDLSENE
ncbi:MAG: hypothetical protein MUC50_06155 [Myxococcota bacterium]|nr:hypothetical protein [Myxococcota bacterium]